MSTGAYVLESLIPTTMSWRIEVQAFFKDVEAKKLPGTYTHNIRGRRGLVQLMHKMRFTCKYEFIRFLKAIYIIKTTHETNG